MVSEADRIKAVERVRRAIASDSGNSPSTFKRKKAVYRALDRGDSKITHIYQMELGYTRLVNSFVEDMFGDNLNTFEAGSFIGLWRMVK